MYVDSEESEIGELVRDNLFTLRYCGYDKCDLFRRNLFKVTYVKDTSQDGQDNHTHPPKG